MSSANGICISFSARCRICQEVDHVDALAEPCNCVAPSQYVHEACLSGQLTTGWRFWDTGMPNLTCDACQADYPRRLIVRPGNRREWSQLGSGALLYLVLRLATLLGSVYGMFLQAPEHPADQKGATILWIVSAVLFYNVVRLPPEHSEILSSLDTLLRDIVVRKRSAPGTPMIEAEPREQGTPMDAAEPLAELCHV